MLHFKLPEIQGDLPSAPRIIYFSCDENYYNLYGLALIKSIVYQIPWMHVHCHVIQKNKDFQKFKHQRVTHTYELIDDDFIKHLPIKSIKNSVSKSAVTITPETIYFACSRFMQLDKIFNCPARIFQIDCDSILLEKFTEKDFDELTKNVRAMRKPKTPEKIIASAISFGSGQSGIDFRKRFSQEMYNTFSQGAYWFVDQDVLEKIFNSMQFDPIPLTWNHWSYKKAGGYFKTAKGRKKDHPAFQYYNNHWLNYKEEKK